MIKLKHLLHPLRTAHIAKIRLLAHLNIRRFASHSKRHFRGDSRYDLQNITDGFRSRPDNSSDDTGVLERVCRAWARAVVDQKFVSACYEPTAWWTQVRQSSLGPVVQALGAGDVTTLRAMYGNFFRDRCATGLVAVPYGMPKAHFRGPIKDVYRHSYMGDTLYRMDYWASETGGRFEVSDLAGPDIGNPFGALISGTLVRTGAEYQHYCAQKILSKLDSGRPSVVVEIGGGYGGMAYYLLRDGGRLTYVDFDVPESIALTSYYLLKAFPSAKFLLYGENELTAEAVTHSDVVLMPLFKMAEMPTRSVNVTFSSHAMSDLSHDAIEEYVNVIIRMTRDYFLYIGNHRGADTISVSLNERCDCLSLVEARSTGWNSHKMRGASEVERLYRFNLN